MKLRGEGQCMSPGFWRERPNLRIKRLLQTRMKLGIDTVGEYVIDYKKVMPGVMFCQRRCMGPDCYISRLCRYGDGYRPGSFKLMVKRPIGWRYEGFTWGI